MSTISPINNSFCLGNSNVAQETIDTVLKDLTATYASTYSDLVAETSLKLKENPDFYQDTTKTGVPFSRFNHGSLSIPPSLIHDQSGEERYFLALRYEISALKNNTPLNALALSLNAMLQEHGIFCNNVDIRLEKGCYSSSPTFWHLDGPAFRRSITICWSSKANWSTHVLDEENSVKYKYYRSEYDNNNEMCNRIEAVAKAAKFGHFYDAKKVLHRAPTLEDLKEEKIGVDDYRLFIRFTQDNFIKL
jgi:hypothetical protein